MTRMPPVSRGRACRSRGRLLALLVLLLAMPACTFGKSSSGATATGAKVAELRSVSDLQERFNQDIGTVRLILLLSPT
jgi:hypothetical protein